MKDLIALCKKHVPLFRCEFDGETWDLWFNDPVSPGVFRGDFPDVQGATGDAAWTHMIDRLKRTCVQHREMAESHEAASAEISLALTRLKKP